MNNFQTILTAVFVAFFILAVLIFSGIIKVGGGSAATTTATGKIVIWGTFNSTPDFLDVFQNATAGNNDLSITYVKKDKATYQQDLIEAFAAGTGPDLFIITPDMIIKNQNFIYTIPYANYAQKTFQDSFVDGANIYLGQDGVIGFPVVVDPIVMYYNKDILSNAGLSQPPTTWNDLLSLAPTLTTKQDNGTILQSMIALGRFDNINNAKSILATLLLQNNNPIMERTSTGYASVLEADTTLSADHVMSFFTQFSDPSNSLYSWNSSLPTSVNMFTQGKLAFYLGHASELFTIQSINPNLSFDVAPVPQLSTTATKRTDADIYAIVVNKKSQNLTSAFSVAGLLSTGDNATAFAAAVSLPPALRSLLATKPTDPYLYTFFTQAIISQSWLDPDPVQSDAIFKELVDNILSSRLSIGDALGKAQSELQLLVNN
jgi:ABC-type glycerol-3-phosphate transport system substrate-binding protein